MIIDAETLKDMDEFKGMTVEELQQKLDAIEDLIRCYTHNNFQNRFIRFEGYSLDYQVFGETSPYLKEGDTVQITKSDINDGLYVLKEVTDEYVTVDKELFIAPINRVTKVEYPEVIKEGVINLLKWEVENRENVGVKSETISRHSVTYYDQDSNNTVMGYPTALLGFLAPFMKARF